MRRLPIYFLIDVSESMIGEPIEQVQQGIATIIQELKTDPHALETVWISIIAFAGDAKTIKPLEDIVTFYPPRFPIGSGTSLSKGLGHLMYELRKNVVKTTKETKGDWKPIVFLFTDGNPTDATQKAIEEWNRNWSKSANLVAISIGNNVDLHLLGTLSRNVLMLEKTDAKSFKEFFKWVTASIKTSSQSVNENKSEFELETNTGEELKKIDLTKLPDRKLNVDDNFVVLAGLCQKTHKTYLMKYKKGIIGNIEAEGYLLENAYPISDEETYKELSDNGSKIFTVNTERLRGVPTCPCCGNQIAFAVCQCGQIHCIGSEEVSTCPACGNKGRYGVGDGGFDVNRKQG